MYKISNYTYSKVYTLLKTGNFKKPSLANTLRKVAAIINPRVIKNVVRSPRRISIGNVRDVIGAFKDVNNKGGKALLDRNNRRTILDIFSSMRDIKTPQQIKRLASNFNNQIDFSDVIKRIEKVYANNPQKISFSKLRRIFQNGVTKYLSPKTKITPFYSRLDGIVGRGEAPLGLSYTIQGKNKFSPHLYIDDFMIPNPYSVPPQYSRALLKAHLDAALDKGILLPRHSVKGVPTHSFYYAYTGGDKNKLEAIKQSIKLHQKTKDYNAFYRDGYNDIARISDHNRPDFITFPGLNIATYNNPGYHYDLVAAMQRLNNTYLKKLNKPSVTLDNLADIKGNLQEISMARAIHQPYIRLPKSFE